MSRWLCAASVEDDKGQHHQFHAFSEPQLNKLVADWTRARWQKEFGTCPEDHDACIEISFDWQSTNAGMGFAHELWSLDPIELEADSPPGDGPYQQPPESFATAAENPHTYPMEIFVNGELSFKLDSEDAEGDLKAIRALMEIRTRKRQNKPLSNRELYATDYPDGVIHRAADGTTKVVKPDGTLRVMEAPLQKRRCITDPEEIADVIDLWHSDPGVGDVPVFAGGPLHEALGWTQEQYARWVETSIPPTPERDGQTNEEGQA